MRTKGAPKPSKGIDCPYTALYASLLGMGVDPSEAMRMGYGEAAWLVEASNQSREAAGSQKVRDATQADIRKLLG